jgi:hypothetical protein
MENTDKYNLIKVLEQLQKDVFNLTTPQNDLLSLYANPTKTVSFFYYKVEAMFDIVFEERPTTINDMADIILEQEDRKKWKFR